MSLSKSFQISRKLKLESMKLNQNTAEIQNESIQEEISPYSEDLLKIKHIMNEKFIEPNSSSTTTSQVSFQPKSLKICSLQQKKLSFFGKSFIRPFQMNMSPIKNLGFGTFGKEFEENYELLQVLGKGHQGTVVKAKDLKTGEIVAIKMLHEKDEEMEMNLKNEYSIISNLTHPNIVQAKNLLHTEKSSILIMEFLESYIPLKEFIDEKFPLSSSQSHSIFFQIIAAIVYLHDRKILHRDLHISNILINPVTEQIKIIDFGLSKRICQTYKSMDSLWTAASKLSSDDAFDFNTPTGLPSFRAPEILSNESWGFKVDVWMAGLILFALANKEYLTTVGVLKKMKGGDKFGNLEARMKMVLVGCLKRNPIERMSSKDVMAILSKNEEEFL